MRTSCKAAVSSVLAIGALALPVTSAGAATTIGATTPGAAMCGMGTSPITLLQSSSPGNSYAAPSAGVITSWSLLAGASVSPQIKLKVGRAAGGNNFAIVGESAPQTPTASTLNTFPTRVPVQAGDLLGNFTSTSQGGCVGAPAAFVAHLILGDVAPGTPAGPFSGQASIQANVSASLEPDADNDGFGDETQDQCATNASTQGACPQPPAVPDTAAPETTITKSPQNKTAKTKAKYKFTSSEANSTFECKTDKKPYKPCTSPKKFGVDEGKHKFAVRAKDAAGNVDLTPAKDKFKVVD